MCTRYSRAPSATLYRAAFSSRAVLFFGLVLSVVSAVWLVLLVNWVSAALAIGAILLYVVFYTMILKRRTSQNIVWGGIAGCMPVLIGWQASPGPAAWTAGRCTWCFCSGPRPITGPSRSLSA